MVKALLLFLIVIVAQSAVLGCIFACLTLNKRWRTRARGDWDLDEVWWDSVFHFDSDDDLNYDDKPTDQFVQRKVALNSTFELLS